MSSDESVVVVATITPLPEHRETVEGVLVELVSEVHTEPGCLRYALQRSREGFVMLERWESKDLLRVHGAGAAAAAANARLAGLLATESVVTVLRPVPAGDFAKGVL
jgi:quinol monooxygenase YgiN